MTRTFTRTGITALIAAIALGCSQQGAAHQPALQGPSPLDSATTTEDVIVVNESDLDDIRAKYTLSEPIGEVSGVAPCESGTVTEECTEAARQQLRQQAAARNANLVVVFESALMQSFPPRLSLKGRLYQAVPR